jgi:hypothetical protein
MSIAPIVGVILTRKVEVLGRRGDMFCATLFTTTLTCIGVEQNLGIRFKKQDIHLLIYNYSIKNKSKGFLFTDRYYGSTNILRLGYKNQLTFQSLLVT